MDQQSPSQTLQNVFNAKKLPYGSQYEINRLVSVGSLTYDNILVEDIDKLAKMGSNREAAPATARLMVKNSFEDDGLGSMPILLYIAATSHSIFQCRVRENFVCKGTCRKSEEFWFALGCRLTRILFGCESVLGKNLIEKRKLFKKALTEDLDSTKKMSFWAGMEVKSSSTPNFATRPLTRNHVLRSINWRSNQQNCRLRIVLHVDLAASTFCVWNWPKALLTNTAKSY